MTVIKETGYASTAEYVAALQAENAELKTKYEVLKAATSIHTAQRRIRELEAELSTLRESMRAGSLLRKVGEPLPKGCYCTPGRCAAPKSEWCRDSAKRDYKSSEDSTEAGKEN